MSSHPDNTKSHFCLPSVKATQFHHALCKINRRLIRATILRFLGRALVTIVLAAMLVFAVYLAFQPKTAGYLFLVWLFWPCELFSVVVQYAALIYSVARVHQLLRYGSW